MARDESAIEISLPNTTDHSSNQYKFVVVSSGNAALASSAGERVVGVLTNDPAANVTARVGVGGVVRVMAGAAISEMDAVATDASAKAKTAVIDSGTGTYSHVFGTALEAAGADGDIISVLVGGGPRATAA